MLVLNCWLFGVDMVRWIWFVSLRFLAGWYIELGLTGWLLFMWYSDS